MEPILGALGGAWIRGIDGIRRPARSGIQSSLLALLVLHCRDAPLSFDLVAEVLWPNKPRGRARNSLRVQTSSLRKVLRAAASSSVPVSIDTEYGGYLLSVPPNAIDIDHFETAIREARTKLATTPSLASDTELTAALDLWGDPYPELIGYLPADSERTRLSEIRELAIDDLFDVRLRRGGSSELVAELDARAVLRPHHERTYGQLMTALYLSGRQADSLAVFQRARKTLIEELGVEPGVLLRKVEAAVLAQTLSTIWLEPAERQQSANAPQLVGRSHELAQLVEQVQTCNFVLVSGEPGIGKSRLLAELRDTPGLGKRILASTAPRDLTSPPLWPILSALGHPSASWAVDAVAEFRRNHSLFQDLAATATVMIIDDFQWADEATVRFLRQAMVDPERSCTVFVLAFRSAATDLTQAPGGFVGELRSRAGVSEIELDVLKPAEIEHLARVSGGDDYTTEQLASLVDRSGGNPLFIHELLRVGPLASVALAGVGALVLERTSELTEQCVSVITTAAVIGEEIQIDLVLVACDESVVEVLDALEAGRRAGLIAAGDGFGTERFSHALTREALASQKSEVQRRQIHDVVAHTLESRVADSPHLRTRIARHRWSAFPLGSPDRVVTTLETAARLSSENFAFSDAVTFLLQAETAADHLDVEARHAQMPQLLCDLGYAQIRSGDSERGRETLTRAASAARASGNSGALTSAARFMLESRSPVAVQESGLVELVEEALALSKGVVSEDRVQLLADLAALRYFTHDRDHRSELAQVAIDMARDLGEPKAQAIASLARCTALNEPSTVHARLEWAASAQVVAHKAASTDFVVLGAAMEITAAVEAGQHRRARRVLTAGKQHLVGLQIPRFDWFLSGWDVLFEIMAGDLEHAETHSTNALMAWENGGHPDGLAAFGAQLSTIRLLQGRASELVDLLSDFFADDRDNVLIGSLLTFAKAASQDPDAPALVDDLLGRIDRGDIRDDVLLLPTLAFATESAALVDCDPGRFAGLIEALSVWPDHHVVVNAYGTGGIYWGSIQHALARAHALANNLEQARVGFARAATEHLRVGAPLFARRSAQALDELG